MLLGKRQERQEGGEGPSAKRVGSHLTSLRNSKTLYHSKENLMVFLTKATKPRSSIPLKRFRQIFGFHPRTVGSRKKEVSPNQMIHELTTSLEKNNEHGLYKINQNIKNILPRNFDLKADETIEISNTDSIQKVLEGLLQVQDNDINFKIFHTTYALLTIYTNETNENVINILNSITHSYLRIKPSPAPSAPLEKQGINGITNTIQENVRHMLYAAKSCVYLANSVGLNVAEQTVDEGHDVGEPRGQGQKHTDFIGDFFIEVDDEYRNFLQDGIETAMIFDKIEIGEQSRIYFRQENDIAFNLMRDKETPDENSSRLCVFLWTLKFVDYYKIKYLTGLHNTISHIHIMASQDNSNKANFIRWDIAANLMLNCKLSDIPSKLEDKQILPLKDIREGYLLARKIGFIGEKRQHILPNPGSCTRSGGHQGCTPNELGQALQQITNKTSVVVKVDRDTVPNPVQQSLFSSLPVEEVYGAGNSAVYSQTGTFYSVIYWKNKINIGSAEDPIYLYRSTTSPTNLWEHNLFFKFSKEIQTQLEGLIDILKMLDSLAANHNLTVQQVDFIFNFLKKYTLYTYPNGEELKKHDLGEIGSLKTDFFNFLRDEGRIPLLFDSSVGDITTVMIPKESSQSSSILLRLPAVVSKNAMVKSENAMVKPENAMVNVNNSNLVEYKTQYNTLNDNPSLYNEDSNVFCVQVLNKGLAPLNTSSNPKNLGEFTELLTLEGKYCFSKIPGFDAGAGAVSDLKIIQSNLLDFEEKNKTNVCRLLGIKFTFRRKQYVFFEIVKNQHNAASIAQLGMCTRFLLKGLKLSVELFKSVSKVNRSYKFVGDLMYSTRAKDFNILLQLLRNHQEIK
jgi:hypothetical protein